MQQENDNLVLRDALCYVWYQCECIQERECDADKHIKQGVQRINITIYITHVGSLVSKSTSININLAKWKYLQ